jgi:hypothetical protein
MPYPCQLLAGFPSRRPGFELGVESRKIYGGQSGTGADLLRVLQFPLPLIPLTAPQSSSIIRGGYIRPNSG